MTKEQIAGILEQIATLLELKGQNSFDPADLPIFQTMVSTYRRGAAIGRVARRARSWTDSVPTGRARGKGARRAGNISALPLNDLVAFILPINNFVE
jgi:hypothetical protein